MNDVIDRDWMETALRGARPRALAALLRYFGTLDEAEEAFQEASLTALTAWPQKGPPRDPAAWLIFVARNRGIDDARRRNKHEGLPEDKFAATDDHIPLGLLLLVCTVLYVISRTAVLGAILLTGYFVGAIETHVRMGESFVFPLVFGVLAWACLCVRDSRVRSFVNRSQ